MPEIIVKIKWDMPQEKDWLCADNIKVALSHYCTNTFFNIQELNPNVPSDRDIECLTMNNAEYRSVLCYDSDWKIMKAGIMKGLSQIFGESEMNLNLYFLNRRFYFDEKTRYDRER